MKYKNWTDYAIKAKLTPVSPSKSKMNNEPTIYNGRLYASKKEAKKATDLDWQVVTGVIRGYRAQVKYDLTLNGVHICFYILDFEIENNDGTFRFIDVKGRKAGVQYQLFKLKQKLMFIIYGIKVEEV